MSEKKHSLGNDEHGSKQYYGGSVPFDLPAVSIDRICANFEKRLKLAIKVQSKYRAPALVNESNVKSVVEGFFNVSHGKDHIVWADLQMVAKKVGVVGHTLERIFKKCDVKQHKEITVREFLHSQYGNANQEELDRAVSFMGKPPGVFGWTIRFFKRLFDKLAHWSGLGLTDEPKVKLCDFYALCVHCKELREFVIRSSRLQRARMRKLATFKEAVTFILEQWCDFDMKSDQSEIIWIWILRTEPPLNKEQKMQLQLLYDSMEHRSDDDGNLTITRYQLENVTDWILPNIFQENLLPYLFYKFHHGLCERLNRDDFVYFMEYIWFVFQQEFTKRKINLMLRESHFHRVHRFREAHTLTPTKSHAMIKTFAEPSDGDKKSKSTSRSVRFTKARLTNAELMKCAVSVKHRIESYGRVKMADMKHAVVKLQTDERYWSNILRKGTAVKAWMRMVFLAIRLEDVQKRDSRAESVVGYMNALDNVDVKTDFKFTKYYSL